MRWRRLSGPVVAIVGAAALAAAPAAIGASGHRTVRPSAAARARILKAFGDPRSGWPCLITRQAANHRRYATVRFRTTSSCQAWAFNGVNVLKRSSNGRWEVLFEASEYSCPISGIPVVVQHDFRLCRALASGPA